MVCLLSHRCDRIPLVQRSFVNCFQFGERYRWRRILQLVKRRNHVCFGLLIGGDLAPPARMGRAREPAGRARWLRRHRHRHRHRRWARAGTRWPVPHRRCRWARAGTRWPLPHRRRRRCRWARAGSRSIDQPGIDIGSCRHRAADRYRTISDSSVNPIVRCICRHCSSISLYQDCLLSRNSYSETGTAITTTSLSSS